MKFYACSAFLFTLAACSGESGGSPTFDPTPANPDVTLNSNFGSMMNGSRTAANDLTYNATVGQVAQDQVNVMLTDNHTSEWSGGATGVGQDVGDRLNARGYNWFSYAARTESGENTVAGQVAEFGDDICQGATTRCYDVPEFEEFGIARAGSGTNTKWLLVLTEPNN